MDVAILVPALIGNRYTILAVILIFAGVFLTVIVLSITRMKIVGMKFKGSGVLTMKETGVWTKYLSSLMSVQPLQLQTSKVRQIL